MVYTKTMSRKSCIQLNWDKNTIETDNAVHKIKWIPVKKRHAAYPMAHLRGYGFGSPLGIFVDILRAGKRLGTAWMYLQFDSGRIYVHDDTDDRDLLQERVEELLRHAQPSTIREESLNKTLPGWATVLVFIFIVVSVCFIGYVVNEVFFKN